MPEENAKRYRVIVQINHGEKKRYDVDSENPLEAVTMALQEAGRELPAEHGTLNLEYFPVSRKDKKEPNQRVL